MNAQRFITFLKCLIKNAERKILFIVDNLQVYYTLIIKYWVKENEDQVELLCFSPCLPELNPNKYLSGALKQDVHNESLVGSVKKRKARVLSYMRALQQLPDYVLGLLKRKKYSICWWFDMTFLDVRVMVDTGENAE